MCISRTLQLIALAATASIAPNPEPALSQDHAVKLDTEASPPLSKTEADSSFTGFEIDLGKEVCERAELNCEWVRQDFDGMIAGLLAEKFDFNFSSMTITDEREEVADFLNPIPRHALQVRRYKKFGSKRR